MSGWFRISRDKERKKTGTEGRNSEEKIGVIDSGDKGRAGYTL